MLLYTLKKVDSVYHVSKVTIEYDKDKNAFIDVLFSDVLKVKLPKQKAKVLKALLADKYKLKVVKCAD